MMKPSITCVSIFGFLLDFDEDFVVRTGFSALFFSWLTTTVLLLVLLEAALAGFDLSSDGLTAATAEGLTWSWCETVVVMVDEVSIGATVDAADDTVMTAVTAGTDTDAAAVAATEVLAAALTTAVTAAVDIDWWLEVGVFGVTATDGIGLTGRGCTEVAVATDLGTVAALVAGISGLVGFGMHLVTDDAVVMDAGLLVVDVAGAMALLGCTSRRRDDVVDGVDWGGIITSVQSEHNTMGNFTFWLRLLRSLFAEPKLKLNAKVCTETKVQLND